MKKTTVVILNWNGMRYLKICLDSLRAQDTDDFEILIIDNASEDESVAFIRENYPEMPVEVMESNLGFSGGVNEGIKRCKTPYVLLLNNDVELDPAFVRCMTAAIEKSDRIFSVSSRMVNYRERDILDDAGDLYTILGWGFQRGVGQKVTDPRYLKPCKVFSACAGAAIYRRAVFDEIGMFDLMHFAYLEDIDVGYRAKIYGYESRYTPDAIVYHVGSASSGATKYSDFKVKISARNGIFLAHKNMSPLQRVLNAFPLYVGRAVKRRFFVKNGFVESYDAGIKEGLERRKETRVVPYTLKHAGNYIAIEFQLIGNTFIYVAEFLKRRLKK